MGTLSPHRYPRRYHCRRVYPNVLEYLIGWAVMLMLFWLALEWVEGNVYATAHLFLPSDWPTPGTCERGPVGSVQNIIVALLGGPGGEDCGNG